MYCGWKGCKSQNCIAIERGLYCDWAQAGQALGTQLGAGQGAGADWALGAGRTERRAQVRAAGERQQAQARRAPGARGSRRSRGSRGIGRAATWAAGACGACGLGAGRAASAHLGLPAGPTGCSCTRFGF